MGRPERGSLELIFLEFPKLCLAPKIAAKAYVWTIFCLLAHKSPQEFASGSKKPKFGQIRCFLRFQKLKNSKKVGSVGPLPGRPVKAGPDSASVQRPSWTPGGPFRDRLELQ